MTIIGFLAKKRHGKDTASDHLVGNYGFKKVALADPLKESISILFGFDDEQLYGGKKEVVDKNWKVTPRKVMQYLGTDIFRKDINNIIPWIEDNFWMNSLKVKYLNALKENPNTKFAVADVRFQNEVDIIHELGGIVIKIVRPGYNTGDSHESESSINKIENYDYLIENSGTLEDFYNKIDKLYKNNFR